MTASNRPWPARDKGKLWGPSYRVALSAPGDDIAVLLLTESSLLLIDNEADHTSVELPFAIASDRRLEVGVTRCDLPKELDSSWKIPWISLRCDTPSVSDSLVDAEKAKRSLEWWSRWLEAPQVETAPADVSISATVFGCFVRSTDTTSVWVPITTGTVRSAHTRPNGWRDLHLDVNVVAPSPPGAVPGREPRDLKLSLVMFATLLIWMVKYFDSRHYDADSGAYGFFNILHALLPGADWTGHIAVALFVVFHHLRMAVGVEFASRDTSFFRAKLHAPTQRRECRAWVESLFLAGIVAASVFLTYLVGRADYLSTALVLSVQGAFVLAYDFVFKDALLEFDEGKSKNVFVVIGDVLFMLTASLILAARSYDMWKGQESHIGANTAAVVLILCIAYVSIFMYEIGFAYWQAMVAAGEEVTEAVRQLWSGNWKRTASRADTTTV